jgi:hypothetical protein
MTGEMHASMTDGEMRGVVLRKLYEKRFDRGGFVAVPFDDLSNQRERTVLDHICDQLGPHGLIKWKPLGSGHGGMAKITADGIDAIAGTARSPITITLHNHSVSVTGSNNQVGNHNSQTTNVGKIIAAIDNATASETEKKEAKGLLEGFSQNFRKKLMSRSRLVAKMRSSCLLEWRRRDIVRQPDATTDIRPASDSDHAAAVHGGRPDRQRADQS